MLQRLLFPKTDFPLLHDYLDDLKKTGFKGEIHLDPSTRLINATDNSVYQVLPQAVLIPRHVEDIVSIFTLAHKPVYHQITFSPRGGGTGTNGQSLNHSIIIDCSKYLNRILEFHPEEQWVRVQPGVILGELNAFLKPHGVFFAPTVSPSSRATVGGMVSTDAAGKGSCVYGKTSEHVLAITAVLADGSVHKSEAISLATLAMRKKDDGLIGGIYRQVDATVCQHRETIAAQFPKLRRFMTGYNLAHVYPKEQPNSFHLNAILTGSEGTLAVVTELTLKVTPIPAFKRLFVLQYADFYDALRDARFLMPYQPHAIETIDATLLALAKTDPTYYTIAALLETQGRDTCAINLVEFAGQDERVLDDKVNGITATWKKEAPIAFAFSLVSSTETMEQLWNLRKNCVGLLGKEPGVRKPVSGIEDSVVPPEHLVDYVAECRALLDKAGLKYGMFGHIDVGCLHVRPALDLSNPDDAALYHRLSEQVAQLTKKYGGVMWGEHGKGFRSEYVPLFFGTTLYPELRKIKKAFDPFNQLNPGKIATPSDCSAEIVSVMGPLRAHYDGEINPSLKSQYELAIHCNGNGACFNYNVLDTMCPSYKATKDRRHSPKGRAALLREWMRLQSMQKKATYSPRWVNSLLKKGNRPDFSHEVYDALNGCLGCKACRTQCPVSVDIPSMKSPFLAAYHSRYWHSVRDYLIAYSEKWVSLQASFCPRAANVLVHHSISRFLLQKIGLVDLPNLSWPSLKTQCRERNIAIMNRHSLEALSEKQRSKAVILVQDWLTSSYDADLVMDYYTFLVQCGYTVYLLECVENGKTWHALGFLNHFKKIAKKTAKQLHALSKLGMPMIGIEPSLTLTYRQEYADLLSDYPFQVFSIEEWLAAEPPLTISSLQEKEAYFVPHCSEKTANPLCVAQWQALFSQFGVSLKTLELGCCGMAGSYGLECEHQTTTRQLFDFGWREALQNKPCLASGFSCRSQVHRLSDTIIHHPIRYLVRRMKAVQR